MARGNASAAGFTLVEVLIAMAITALISVVAYTGLSSALSGAESLAQRERACPQHQSNLGTVVARSPSGRQPTGR